MLIHIAALFNKKARLWANGRKNVFENLEKKLATINKPSAKLYWFHCSSLGEFEQGRPLIEKTREKENVIILVSFFSPSGYEIRKNYPLADYVFYLPTDTQSNAKKILATIKPTAVFFIKYEFWFNILNALKQNKIPVYLVSGVFRPEQHFFKWYGSWFAKQLKNFEQFFLQNETSQKLLNQIGYKNTTLCGDTRFDRVAQVALQKKEIEIAKQFSASAKTIVAGSTWPADETILADAISNDKLQNMKLIIAPHEIDEQHLAAIEKSFNGKKIVRFSKADVLSVINFDVLIIDNIGMLSSLYQYAYIAYIGGAFDKGLHNILEAAAHGCPILFGPNHKKFAEAAALIDAGGAFEINSTAQFINYSSMLLNEPAMQKMAALCSKNYVNTNKGACDIILNQIAI
jgi:3-deoxy-D-manno-octulosonic-acid transferase